MQPYNCSINHALRNKDIEMVVLETRPYEWVTFKNVSLKPGQKTEVKIEPPAGHSERSEESDKLTPPQASPDPNSQLEIVNYQLLSTPPQADR